MPPKAKPSSRDESAVHNIELDCLCITCDNPQKSCLLRMTLNHQATMESASTAGCSAATATTTAASLPSSHSNGSLTQLVNRTSNPIISTEDDASADDGLKALEDHLKADQEVFHETIRRASFTDQSPPASNAASFTGGSVQNNIVAVQELVQSVAPAVHFDTSNVAAVDNGGMAAADGGNPRKLSPMSSRVSPADQLQLQTNSSGDLDLSIDRPISPRARSGSSPKVGVTSSPSDASFDLDPSRHVRKKGTGYLASQASLLTPTDEFASGCTLLQLCAIGNLQAVQDYVHGNFGNVNFRDYDRRTALHVAASEGHLDVVIYLVHKGANVNRSDRWGGSPLDDAHRHRHADVAKYLRSKGGKTGSLNTTANLIAAAAAGDIEEVMMLCAPENVDQKALDLSGSMARGLGKKPSGEKTMSERSAMDRSSSRSRRGLAGKGTEDYWNWAPSPKNAGHRKQASMDISEPALAPNNAIDINKGDYDSRTALHLAAGEGHLDVVKYLCKRGANVNAEDRWGGKPLDDALQKGNEEVAKVLKKYGAMDTESLNLHRTSDVLSSSVDVALSATEDENMRVDFAELEMIERIGTGAFGEIYKCRWRGILVAAKCIKASKIQKEWLLKRGMGMTDHDRIRNRVDAIKQTTITEEEKEMALEDFRRETAIMRRLRHPNIVMMLAYCHTEEVEVMISEICRCSLLDIFKANTISNSQIPKRTQIMYAQQLAQGMNHLHKCRPPIIHRDLKPANLLIDFSGTLKIADFGLAKIRPNPEQREQEAFLMTGETGSYRFMAPEVFRHEEYTESVDVYSYAMIFYYMLRSTPPWAGLSGLDAVTKAAVDGERPLIPRNVDERLSTLLTRCWDETASARPSFEEIITCLDLYSRDVYKTNNKEAMWESGRESGCKGCVIS
ncbi:hypothetical protein ACHAXT_005308 [Thalassiosira profunda]